MKTIFKEIKKKEIRIEMLGNDWIKKNKNGNSKKKSTEKKKLPAKYTVKGMLDENETEVWRNAAKYRQEYYCFFLELKSMPNLYQMLKLLTNPEHKPLFFSTTGPRRENNNWIKTNSSRYSTD